MVAIFCIFTQKNRDYSSFLTEIIEDFVFSKKYLDLTIVTLIFDFLKIF